MGQTWPLFCLFSFFSHDKYSTNTINEKAQMACLGLEPRAAGWQGQTNPLSYGGTPRYIMELRVEELPGDVVIKLP